MEHIINIMNKNNGFARFSEFKKERLHSRIIAKALSEGIICKVKPGLYKLVDYQWEEFTNYYDIYLSNKHAVICLASASYYYGLTTYTPATITLAVPHNYSKMKIDYPPIKVYYFSDLQYKTGIEEIVTKNGEFKIYNQEKTIIDLYRYKNKIGEDIFIESLKNYLKQANRDINKLLEYSTVLKVKEKFLPYLKAII